MSGVLFYGASDDLIEVEGEIPGCDEYNAEDASFVVVCENGSVCIVRVNYTSEGTWQVGVRPIGENVPMPEAFVSGEGYTARISVIGALHVTQAAST